MKMKKTDTKITRYKHGSFNVDVIEKVWDFGGTGFDVYLSHDDYGVSELMFGVFREQDDHTYTDKEMLEIIDANLPQYEMMYLKDRIEEESEVV